MNALSIANVLNISNVYTLKESGCSVENKCWMYGEHVLCKRLCLKFWTLKAKLKASKWKNGKQKNKKESLNQVKRKYWHSLLKKVLTCAIKEGTDIHHKEKRYWHSPLKKVLLFTIKEGTDRHEFWGNSVEIIKTPDKVRSTSC